MIRSILGWTSSLGLSTIGGRRGARIGRGTGDDDSFEDGGVSFSFTGGGTLFGLLITTSHVFKQSSTAFSILFKFFFS